MSPIGKSLYRDVATMQKTKDSVGKVQIQVDLTKEKPRHVGLGYSVKKSN